MTWTKLGDEFADETMDLSSDAFRLHVEALIWSNRKLADLLVPARMLPRLTALEDPGTAVDELIRTGWWQQIDEGTYWIGCRFPEWQRDRVQVEHRREQLALAQRRKRRHDLGDHSLCLQSRCKALSTVDASVDASDDPGRVGTGRETTPKTGLEEGAKVCCVCGSTGSLLAGKDGKLRCRRHHFDQAAA